MDRTRSDTLLRVDGLTKRFGTVQAVSSISFEVAAGEFFTLLGPSGCGKSTTLMAIAGFERPDEGRINLRGRDITSTPPEKRDIGVVFQNYALFPHMTVLRNVAFPLRMRGVSSRIAEEKAATMLDLVELPAGNVLPGQLSGGQMQRVALARALVFEPDLLLMDEPLAALDRRLRQALQYELRRIQARLGTTVVYVTHDQEEALVLSDRIGVMRAGRFEQVAGPAELYEQPANGFVANFLGESNRTPVQVIDRCGDLAIVSPTGDDARLSVVSKASVGDPKILFLRPEHVRLGRAPEGLDQHESCHGTVTDIAFLGDHIRVEVRVFGDERWLMHVPTDGSACRPGIGETVTLVWERSSARLIDM